MKRQAGADKVEFETYNIVGNNDDDNENYDKPVDNTVGNNDDDDDSNENDDKNTNYIKEKI